MLVSLQRFLMHLLTRHYSSWFSLLTLLGGVQSGFHPSWCSYSHAQLSYVELSSWLPFPPMHTCEPSSLCAPIPHSESPENILQSRHLPPWAPFHSVGSLHASPKLRSLMPACRTCHEAPSQVEYLVFRTIMSFMQKKTMKWSLSLTHCDKATQS